MKLPVPLLCCLVATICATSAAKVHLQLDTSLMLDPIKRFFKDLIPEARQEEYGNPENEDDLGLPCDDGNFPNFYGVCPSSGTDNYPPPFRQAGRSTLPPFVCPNGQLPNGECIVNRPHPVRQAGGSAPPPLLCPNGQIPNNDGNCYTQGDTDGHNPNVPRFRQTDGVDSICMNGICNPVVIEPESPDTPVYPDNPDVPENPVIPLVRQTDTDGSVCSMGQLPNAYGNCLPTDDDGVPVKLPRQSPYLKLGRQIYRLSPVTPPYVCSDGSEPDDFGQCIPRRDRFGRIPSTLAGGQIHHAPGPPPIWNDNILGRRQLNQYLSPTWIHPRMANELGGPPILCPDGQVPDYFGDCYTRTYHNRYSLKRQVWNKSQWNIPKMCPAGQLPDLNGVCRPEGDPNTKFPTKSW